MTDLKRIVEALLFAADFPIQLDRMVEISGAGRAEVREAIKDLDKQYSEGQSAFAVTEVAGGWQLYCRPEYSKWIRELHKGRVPSKLSQAALETLAIIAYKQPLVRAEIEVVRGVDSSGVLSTLLKRNVITIAGRAPGMGRALMYRTTKEFLRYFGLNTITDLPRLEEFAEILGLAHSELEMTIEGAEHLAGVTAEASKAEETTEGDAHTDETPPDESEARADETSPDESEVHMEDSKLIDALDEA